MENRLLFKPSGNNTDVGGSLNFIPRMDRETIIKDVLFSQSQIPATYLPVNHPYAVEGLATIAHDTTRGISLLEEVG